MIALSGQKDGKRNTIAPARTMNVELRTLISRNNTAVVLEVCSAQQLRGRGRNRGTGDRDGQPS